MLVIKPRGGAGGMRRYAAGSGIFDSISRKMFASGLKKAISTGAKFVIAQKVADAVVKGATSTVQKATESAVNEAINSVKPYVKKLVVGQKRPPISIETVQNKIPKIDINSLIDGSGIVFD